MSFNRHDRAAVCALIHATLLFAPSAFSATLDSRAAAAAAAANGSSCSGISFYWEVGDKDGNYRSGQRTALLGLPVSRYTQGLIASAGKWIYATYALEKAGGAPDSILDIPMLNFTSGYDSLGSCSPFDTVAACGSASSAPLINSSVGRFSYSPAHMEHHGAADALGSLDTASLVASSLGPVIASAIGIPPNTEIPNPVPNILKPKITVGLKYVGPVFAGDASIDAGSYATMLQRILSGTLQMGAFLGANAVCASDQKDASGKYYCSSDGGQTANVVYVPPFPTGLDSGARPNGVPWNYSIGHWVEKDGAYSAIGAFGFYPWIDKDKQWYGIISRFATTNIMAYQDSLICGRAIRNAWLTAP